MRSRLHRWIALPIAALCLVALSACMFNRNEETPVSGETETQLEAALLSEIDIAEGVFVAQSSSGFENTTVVVRLYVDSDETSVLAPAVDRAFETTWNTWPQRPSAIQVEVVVGPKPADAGRVDDNVRDLADVAEVLDIEPKNVHLNIRLSGSLLIARYGE